MLLTLPSRRKVNGNSSNSGVELEINRMHPIGVFKSSSFSRSEDGCGKSTRASRARCPSRNLQIKFCNQRSFEFPSPVYSSAPLPLPLLFVT